MVLENLIVTNTVNDLLALCKDKSVILVGNSCDMLHNKHADLIDSHDVVVRFGVGLLHNKDKDIFLGRKVDIWIAGSAALIEVKRRKKLKTDRGLSDLLERNSILTLHNRSRNDVSKLLSKYACSFLEMFSDKEISDYYSKYSVDSTVNRFSAGLWTLLFFLDKVKVFSKLSLVGFDNFRPNNKIKRRSGFCVSWHNDGLSNEVHSHRIEETIMNSLILKNDKVAKYDTQK